MNCYTMSSKQLDLAFALDTTSSMRKYIISAKDNIRRIVEEIVAVEKCDVRLALVNYRDHPPEENTYVTQVYNFTSSAYTMRGWLDSTTAVGGGDTPEAVADALRDVYRLSWRKQATKICVCISDAPPHGLGLCSRDGFPNGCPLGIDPVAVTDQMASKGITLYVVGCEPSITSYKSFFMGIAHKTGGQYVPLSNAASLAGIIIGSAREEMDLERLMGEVDAEVRRDIGAGRAIHEDEMTKRMQAKMKAKGVQTKQLRRNDAALESALSSAGATAISKVSTMEEAKTNFKTSVESSGTGSGPVGYGSGIESQSVPLASGAVPTATSMPPGVERFEVTEAMITEAQTSRLVKKSLARNMVNKK